MVSSFLYKTRSRIRYCKALRGGESKVCRAQQPCTCGLSLVQTGRGPALELHAQGQPAGGEHFLDFVERLPTQVRGLQQLVLGTLDQVTDVVDVLGLQTVGRPHRQLELVDRAQQDGVELLGATRRGL